MEMIQFNMRAHSRDPVGKDNTELATIKYTTSVAAMLTAISHASDHRTSLNITNNISSQPRQPHQ